MDDPIVEVRPEEWVEARNRLADELDLSEEQSLAAVTALFGPYPTTAPPIPSLFSAHDDRSWDLSVAGIDWHNPNNRRFGTPLTHRLSAQIKVGKYCAYLDHSRLGILIRELQEVSEWMQKNSR